MTDFFVGDTLHAIATMVTYAASPAVYASVILSHRNPSGVVATYGIGAGLSAIASGVLTTDIPLNIAGDHWFRFEAHGSNSAAEEFSLYVRPSQF